MVPLDRFGMVSYWCSIVTLSIERTVFGDIRLVNIVVLETRVRGHSRSSKLIPFGNGAHK